MCILFKRNYATIIYVEQNFYNPSNFCVFSKITDLFISIWKIITTCNWKSNLTLKYFGKVHSSFSKSLYCSASVTFPSLWLDYLNYFILCWFPKCFVALPATGEFCKLLMTFANNLDPDEAPQNMGPLLRSKLFDCISTNF